ncbi:TonB-dependent receptor [Bowmanella denitrificans]|uniref:TonB-dependent receptor n=1 Tax=Bowmanella denitrificans TaxID=366582 RepID=A0ABN0XE39_9ALTE
MQKRLLARSVSLALTLGATSGMLSTQAVAQEGNTAEQAVEKISVTGSRIRNPDMIANSPMLTVDSDEIGSRADITLDTFLNTLPQVNPAGGTTSNNPGNNGQSNIDLRGLGSNRNLVLVDGRRVMVSASDMTVDLNTIPAAMIDSIEIITGGAGAAYGADAVSGAVNLKLKDDFEGFQFDINHSNHMEEKDAEEYGFSTLLGANFEDGRGNAIIAFDYSKREGMIKSQRPFSANATSTTTFFPEGIYNIGGNGPSQAAVDQVFGQYGIAAGAVPAGQSIIGFNTDGSLFSAGVFNQPYNVENWRYPVDLGVNSTLFPDRYSYNFDAVNILVLPLERKTFSTKFDYQVSDSTEIFATAGWTNYSSEAALAPTPFPTVFIQGVNGTDPNAAISKYVEPDGAIGFQLVVPTTNPFIPDDFRTILNSRTGDNPNLVGSGADEAFQMRQRSLWGGLRTSEYDNTVIQYTLGARGNFNDFWSWEVYGMQGKTTVKESQTGNLDTQKVQNLIEAADGGASICEGGYNPFGRNEVSQACKDYMTIGATVATEYDQQILQGFVSGDLFETHAGMASLVVGYEVRKFEYDFDPGSLSGPVSGFNTQDAAGGKNQFNDIFLEAFFPLVDGMPFAESVDLTLGYRTSKSKFTDTVKKIEGDSDTNSAYKAELSWNMGDNLPRVRASYQRAVRAPNFGELFDGSASNPQFFDPCSVTSEFRKANGDAGTALCKATGVADPATFVQTPGGQVSIDITGNVDLSPEKADTFTLGAVHTFENGLSMSLDYYKIDIDDAIIDANVNLIIADCYNFYGNNSSLSADYNSCQFIQRFGGDDILGMANPEPGSGGALPGVNSGFIKTSGFDFQAGYNFEASWLGGASVNMNLYVNHVMEYKTKELPFLPAIDYADTIAYFGVNLGQSFPAWKANFNTMVSFDDFDFALRGRYIDGMDNRLNVEMPLEIEPTGTDAVMYWDTSLTYHMTENHSLRLGINNLFDQEPETYAPNVQSGTDPSLYDVVGRRITVSASLRF